MASSSSGICWPSRFPLRLTAFFLGALVVGMLLGVLLRKRPKPASSDHPMADIIVRGKYDGTNDYVQIAANIYYVNDGAIDKTQVIPTFPNKPAFKTDTSGSPTTFEVEQVDLIDKGNGTYERVPLNLPRARWTGSWVKKMHDTLDIKVDLKYPKPSSLHY